MIRAVVGVAEPRIRFVVAAARAKVSNSASLAMGPFTVDRLADEGAQALAVDPRRDVAESRQVGTREAMTQIELAIAVDREQADPRPARQGLAPALVEIRHQLVHVREPVVVAAQRRTAIVLPEALERAMHLRKLLVGQRMARLGGRGHGRISHLVKTKLSSQMDMNRFDLRVAATQRHACTHRPRAIAFEQQSGFARDHFVGTPSADALAMTIMNRLRSVHGDRNAEPVCIEIIDQGRRDRKSTRLNSSHTVISYAV